VEEVTQGDVFRPLDGVGQICIRIGGASLVLQKHLQFASGMPLLSTSLDNSAMVSGWILIRFRKDDIKANRLGAVGLELV